MAFTQLWQSKNGNYKNSKSVAIVFAILGTICIITTCIVNNEIEMINKITKYVFSYVSIIMFCLSVLFLLLHFYVFNNIHRSKIIAKYSLTVLFALLSLFTLVIGIPFLILLCVIVKVTDIRAKKINNLIYVLIYFVIVLLFICGFIYPTSLMVIIISSCLGNLLETKYHFNLNVFCVELFLLLSFLKLQMDIIYSCILFIHKKLLYHSKNKMLKTIEQNLGKSISPNIIDIKAHIQAKSDAVKIEEDKLNQSINYDLNYLKNTLTRVQLAILIIIFTVVTLKIAPQNWMQFLDEHQGDIINVVTIYTLIILYLDKRKDWK